MHKLALFSASNDQYRYFKQLVEQVDLPIGLTHYKSLWRPAFNIDFPIEAINKQVEILFTRKKNSHKDKHRSKLYWALFSWFNRQKAKWLYRQYQAWLSQLDADYIGVWNGKKFRQAILVLAAKQQQKEIVYFETGPLPGYSAIDPVGVDYFSAIPREADFYLTRPMKNKPFKLEQSFPRPESIPEHYIFVPFQVVEDSNIYLHSPWLKDMRQLYAVLIHACEANPTLEFVIKPHPACPEKYDDMFENAHPRIQFTHNAPSQALVQHADAVLTINSTVGMEALIARKKVIVLGQAIYGFTPLTYPMLDQQTLNTALAALDDWTLDTNLIDHYLDYLAEDYAVPGDAMKSPNQKHWEEVERKLALMLNGKMMQAIGMPED